MTDWIAFADRIGPMEWGHTVSTGKGVLAASGIEPGQPVEVRVRKADADAVDVPPGVATRRRCAGRSPEWKTLTPGKRRGLLDSAATAKKPDPRERRIAARLAGLRGRPP